MISHDNTGSALQTVNAIEVELLTFVLNVVRNFFYEMVNALIMYFFPFAQECKRNNGSHDAKRPFMKFDVYCHQLSNIFTNTGQQQQTCVH